MTKTIKHKKRVRGIIIHDGKLILIKRVKLDEVYYVIPGGGVEIGENNLQALKRECREELGIDVDIKSLICKRIFKDQKEFFYFCLINSGKIGTGNGPEFNCNAEYEGEHIIELVDFPKLNNKNLKPKEIKDELISLWSSCKQLSKSEKFGKIKTKTKEYFFKVLNPIESKRELVGYKKIKEFYPVPQFLFQLALKCKIIHIYEYEKSVDLKDGLLADYFANHSELDKKYFIILKLYKKVFLKTIKRDKENCADIFFENRIKTRINKFYSKEFISSYQGKKIMINGNEIQLNLTKIFKELKSFFGNHRVTWTIISQCDPNDLNIGVKPLIFDYQAGGRVPFMAEFATFVWYNLVQGNYLSLIYNRHSFKGHEDIFNKLDKVFVQGKSINHRISPIRQEAISAYIRYVVRPVMNKIGPYNFYLEFKNYLAMKIMAVFNVRKMSHKDLLLCLAYLQYFYDQEINSIDELINILNELWLKK
ncbi:MAG: hypothetical protein COU51_04470 [Parcubacteria group bacterium CG10_big_fil_rev_8_21_14_0_10_36_14]|nr:MAG: hypothetical protein COU51_04470 [Parcubacteria group bacterium CG10_big_fil_rev_8_21_14_0_10_36_14]